MFSYNTFVLYVSLILSKVGKFNIAKTIASANSFSSSSRGRNSISPHIDTVANLPSARKCMDGFASKPEGSSWWQIKKNCMNSSKLHSFAVGKKIHSNNRKVKSAINKISKMFLITLKISIATFLFLISPINVAVDQTYLISFYLHRKFYANKR